MKEVGETSGAGKGMFRSAIYLLTLLLMVSVYSGCGKKEAEAERLPPVAIEKGDECHVCGMIITRFPGPKGEVYTRNASIPKKFCSTRDLFSYLLQPEVQAAVTQAYVHDMGATEWEHPSDSAFVDAREAWYAVGHPMKGAMGATLASFKEREAAQRFVDKHGGKLLGYEAITMEVLNSLDDGGMESHPMPMQGGDNMQHRS